MTEFIGPLTRSKASERMAGELKEADERITELLKPFGMWLPEVDRALAGDESSAFNIGVLSGYLTARYYGKYTGLYDMLVAGIDGQSMKIVADALITLHERLVADILSKPQISMSTPGEKSVKDPSDILFGHLIAAHSEPEDLMGTWNDYVDRIVREADWITERFRGIDVDDAEQDVSDIEDRIAQLKELLNIRHAYSLDRRYHETWEGAVIRSQAAELPNFITVLFYTLGFLGKNPESLRESIDDSIAGVSRLFRPVAYLKKLYGVIRSSRDGIRMEFPKELPEEPIPANRVPMFHIANEILYRVGDLERKDDPPTIAVGWEGNEFVVADGSKDGNALHAFGEGEAGSTRIMRLAQEMGGQVTFVERKKEEAAGAMAGFDIAAIRIAMPLMAAAPLARPI